MKNRSILGIFSLLLTPIYSIGSSVIENKVSQAYKRQQSEAQVHCEHAGLRFKSNKFSVNNYIETQFEHDGLDFSILVKKDGRKFKATLRDGQKKLQIYGTVGKKNKPIEFSFRNLSSQAQAIVERHKFKDLRCNVEVYKDKPVALKLKKVHINMHPHSNYDSQGITTDTVESYLYRDDIQNIVLLDNSDLSRSIKLKNFMKNTGVNYRLANFSAPVVNIPENVPVFASSAGHNLFTIKTDNLEVTYTGGNLNYCILNNVRRLMDSFLQYSEGGHLDIIFDLDGIVAQKGSWLNNANFSGGGGSGYFVQKEFRNKPKRARKFHKAFAEFFGNEQLTSFVKRKLFSNVNYSYESPNSSMSKVLEGSGTGNYSISIKFINN